MAQEKRLYVIGGANGSGKSTFAQAFFRKRKEFFINPDALTAAISPSHQTGANVEAARLMKATIEEKLKLGESFAFESTLSGRTRFNYLERAKENGYQIFIYYVYLNKVSKNLDRIKNRVAEGGHDIPAADVRRRYGKSFYNFWTLYRPLADAWALFDNSYAKPKLKLSKSEFDQYSPEKQTSILRDYYSLFGVKNGI